MKNKEKEITYNLIENIVYDLIRRNVYTIDRKIVIKLLDIKLKWRFGFINKKQANKEIKEALNNN